MKNNSILTRILICGLVFGLILPFIPIEPILYTCAAAKELMHTESTVKTSEDEKAVEIGVNTEVVVNANHRTMSVLDAGKYSNVNNRFQSDYKPNNLKERLNDLFPEYNFADITEYEGFANYTRMNVFVK